MDTKLVVARPRSRRRTTVALTVALATALTGFAATGSVANAAVTSAGGLVAAGTPTVSDVVCMTRCVDGRKATPGATVAVKGQSLAYVRGVVFRGEDGPMRVRPSSAGTARVRAVVPSGAVTSRPFVIDFRGQRSNRSPRTLAVLPPSEIPVEVFPVRGRHQYWDGFGAGRGHDGMDIGAACGTRMVAARAGRVEHRAYHGAAGNYVVIDSRDSNTDLVYMHLASPSPLRAGQSVGAGQTIGQVGETGNASGCHLHFELWMGDWYGGGHPVDPERFLRGLDRQS